MVAGQVATDLAPRAYHRGAADQAPALEALGP